MTPLHRQIVVAATAGRAFAVFTTEIGLWWPLERFSVGGAGSSLEFKNGRLVETAADGDTHEWGEVTAWAPPERLAFSWHPGRPDEPASHVEVTFVEVADGTTLVTLTHTGWERLAEPAAAREEYRNGWPLVMARLGDAIGTEPAAPTVAAWFALLHTSNLTPELSVFADDRFAGHVAFLQWLDGRGWLVAAGPLGDQDGAGLTVARVPGDKVGELVEAAHQQDASVAEGLFDVLVRPWQVRLATPQER
ncbi:MAG: SRPBCC domain-containing protein [Micropruina glycogenica]